jgi:hypothetical protein
VEPASVSPVRRLCAELQGAWARAKPKAAGNNRPCNKQTHELSESSDDPTQGFYGRAKGFMGALWLCGAKGGLVALVYQATGLYGRLMAAWVLPMFTTETVKHIRPTLV